MSLRHFLDYYRGRISYTEAINMPMKVYHTFTYIMYRENLERERQEKLRQEKEAAESKARADAERKQQQIIEEQNNIPQNGREAILQRIRQNSGNRSQQNPSQKEYSNVSVSQQESSFPLPQSGIEEDLEEIVEEGMM